MDAPCVANVSTFHTERKYMYTRTLSHTTNIYFELHLLWAAPYF